MKHPEFITAKNHGLKRYILWRVDEYHYQITAGQNGLGSFTVKLDLPGHTYQQAERAFIAFRA